MVAESWTSLPGRWLERVRGLDPLAVWADAVESRLEEAAFQQDPEFLASLVPWMERYGRWFDAEVRGLERVPCEGPVLLVGNHSGGGLTPDTAAFLAAWYERFGLERLLVGLAFDAAFAIPGFGRLMRAIGQVPASPENARRALDESHALLVYPGGDHDLFRPWTQRHRIDFGGRQGFVRLALEAGVPVVPVVGQGGHEASIVLFRSERLARLLGLQRIRMRELPILWQLPWGLSLPGPVYLPMPVKITMQVGEPLDWRHYGPEAAGDPEIVQRCYDEVTERMQDSMDALAREHPFPLWSRLRALLPGAGGVTREPGSGGR